MTIIVQCPHCETKFNLNRDMIGKSMRCPNLECRLVFVVAEQPQPVEPPRPEPTPVPASRPAAGKPSAVIPLPPEPQPQPKEPAPRPAAPTKPRKPEKPRPAVVDNEIVEAVVVTPPKVKEVVWSEGTDVPPPPSTRDRRPARPEVVDEPDDELPLRRKKKKNRRPLILIGMLVFGFVLIGATVFYILRFQDLAEAKMAEQAEAEFKKEDYAAAARSYEKLAAEYPNSTDAEKYKFFADLAGLQLAVRAVTNRDDYEPAVKKLRAFIESQKGSPLARPGSGFGRDVHEAGKKLGEDIVAHAQDRVAAYQQDRSKSGELERAEKAIAAGRGLLPLLEPFRPSDELPPEAIRKGLDDAEKSVKWERDRAAAIARARGRLTNPTDPVITAVEAELREAGFLADAEVQGLIAAAKGKLRDLVRYEPDPAERRAPPASAAATLLFVAPVGPTRPRGPSDVGSDTPPSVFLALARGILYALDEENGALLWAVRVGTDVTDPPTVARVNLPEGPTDIALVTSNVGGQSAVAAYDLRTGEARWYQPLEVADPTDRSKRIAVPAAGPAVVVGGRAYVAVLDEQGTIYEFDLTKGTREGRIRLGQPIGPGLIVRPGTGLLYAAADARRVYVIDAGAKDDDGNPLRPRCVQVIATNHPAGTLRTPPLLIGPEGDSPAERWMILSQADGPTTMKLRAFPVLPIEPPPADGKLPPETPTAPAVELPVAGWAWFPPVSDGERLAVATDAGQFRLFGVNQPGSFDRALFPLATPAPTPWNGTAIPGLVFPAEESAFWVLSRGDLQKYRLGLVPGRGLEVNPVGTPVLLGVPTQPPQLNSRRDAAFLVVRSQNSAGCKAVVLNLRDGELRWQRQLGIVPVTAPIPQGDSVLLVAEDGGLVLVPNATGAAAGRNAAAPPAWVIAPAPEKVTSPTAVAVSSDGKTVVTVTPVLVRENQKDLTKFLIRRVVSGAVTHEGQVNAPGGLAGPPILLGDSLLLAATDGFVYRHVPGSGRLNPDSLVPGPPWGAERRTADTVCYLTPLSDTAFLTSDASKKLARWDWPTGGKWNPAGAWELRERPAGPGLVLPGVAGGPPRLLVADVTGSVWLYPADRGGQPLKRWRPGAGIPAGKPSSPFVAQPDSSGRLVVTYTVESKFLVGLDPDKDAPLWARRIGEDMDSTFVGPPQPAGGGRWLVTDLGGRVAVFDDAGQQPVPPLVIGLPGVVPAAAGASLAGSAVLTSLSDGSAVVIGLPAAPTVAPPPADKK